MTPGGVIPHWRSRRALQLVLKPNGELPRFIWFLYERRCGIMLADCCGSGKVLGLRFVVQAAGFGTCTMTVVLVIECIVMELRSSTS